MAGINATLFWTGNRANAHAMLASSSDLLRACQKSSAPKTSRQLLTETNRSWTPLLLK